MEAGIELRVGQRADIKESRRVLQPFHYPQHTRCSCPGPTVSAECVRSSPKLMCPVFILLRPFPLHCTTRALLLRSQLPLPSMSLARPSTTWYMFYISFRLITIKWQGTGIDCYPGCTVLCPSARVSVGEDMAAACQLAGSTNHSRLPVVDGLSSIIPCEHQN